MTDERTGIVPALAVGVGAGIPNVEERHCCQLRHPRAVAGGGGERGGVGLGRVATVVAGGNRDAGN